MKACAAKRFFLGLVMALLPGVCVPLAVPGRTPVVEKAYVGVDGSVHILVTGQDGKVVPKEKDQVGSGELRIADDKKTVGWLAEYENCCTSYAIPLKLVIYRDGKVRQRLGDGMMIYDWRFWEGGTQAAFCSGTVHGDSGGHCELHDASSGRTLDTLDGHLDGDSPKWAAGMRN
jgi:hypothetical protein